MHIKENNTTYSVLEKRCSYSKVTATHDEKPQ